MNRRSVPRASLAIPFLFGWLSSAGCRQPPTTVKYVGSSTVANFLRDAEDAYRHARFEIDDAAESDGGERAILAGETDFAGIARDPDAETLRAGIASVPIGRDAIAVIVNETNPLAGLAMDQLRDIFTGKTTNWSEVGWRDLPIRPLIVGSGSATRDVFRNEVLGDLDYEGCEVVQPDREITDLVKRNPEAIGQISFSFLKGVTDVRALAVNGEEPDVANFDYPLGRDLYLLLREGKNAAAERFAKWAQTPPGQKVVMERFVGLRVVVSRFGSELESSEPLGTLVVYTETFPHYDGGIWYYPHRPYDLLTRHGDRIRRVRNHRGLNDEKPMRMPLQPGIYLVEPETSDRRRQFLIKIEAGRTYVLNVPEASGARKR